MRLLLAAAITATAVTGAVAIVQHRAEDDPTAAFCEQLRADQDIDDALATLDPATVSGAASRFRTLAELAPEPVADDVATLARFTSEMVEAVEGAPGQEEQAVSSLARNADLGAVAEAGESLAAYGRDICAVELS